MTVLRLIEPRTAKEPPKQYGILLVPHSHILNHWEWVLKAMNDLEILVFRAEMIFMTQEFEFHIWSNNVREIAEDEVTPMYELAIFYEETPLDDADGEDHGFVKEVYHHAELVEIDPKEASQ